MIKTMAMIQTHEDLLRDLDASYGALQRLARGQSSPTVKGWLIHFNHVWAQLLKQAGWPAVPSRREVLLNRLFPFLRRFRTREEFAWISPIWSREGLFLSFPPQVVDYPTAYGFQFSSSGLDFWEVMGTGHYSTEICETLLLLRLLPGIDRFIDIGANIGFYSLFMATQSAGRVSVSCYEPSTVNFKTLCRTISLNRQESTIEAFHAAVGSEPGESDLYLCPTGSGGHSLEPVSVQKRDRPCERVPVVTLDQLYHRGAMESARALIKIDVEGAEHAVFSGGREWLTSERQPILLFEAWPESRRYPRRNHHVLVRQLRQSAYRVFSIEKFRNRASPLRDITSSTFRPAPYGNYLALPGWALSMLPEINKPMDQRIFTDTGRLQAITSFISRSKDALEKHLVVESPRVAGGTL